MVMDGPCLPSTFYASELLKPTEVVKLIQLVHGPRQSWFDYFTNFPRLRWVYYQPNKPMSKVAHAVFGKDPHVVSPEKNVAIARANAIEYADGKHTARYQYAKRLSMMISDDILTELEWARINEEPNNEKDDEEEGIKVEDTNGTKKRKVFQPCGVGPPEYSSDSSDDRNEHEHGRLGL